MAFYYRRFTTKLTSNSQWVRERSHEAYAKNYSIVYPQDQPLAARNQRKDALYEVNVFLLLFFKADSVKPAVQFDLLITLLFNKIMIKVDINF